MLDNAVWGLLVVAAVTGTGPEPVVLVADGQARAVVVIADEPTEVAKYAATELVYHVEKATGVRLPVVREGELPKEPASRVYLGTTEAAKAHIEVAEISSDSFVLRTVGDSLYVVGRDSDGSPLSPDTRAGTLFGVYQLLEDVLGVRWLWPGELGEHVPAARTVSVPPLDKTVAPRLVIRRLRSTLRQWEGLAGSEDSFSREALAKAKADEAKWLRRQRMGHSRAMRWGHAFTGW